MPNWCFTDYALTGDTEEIKSLHDRMERLQNMAEPLKPNGYGTKWLGCLVVDLGEDDEKVSCRGSWDNLSLENDVLRFTTETAWAQCSEVEDLIRKKYPSVSVFFCSEESGMGIYVKNSDFFFSDDFIITCGENDTEYCSEEGLINIVSDFLNIDIDSIDQCIQLIDHHNSINEEDYENRISLHEFTLV